MRDISVKNVSSTGSQVRIGDNYWAKVDDDGMFRVKDLSGRWSKYGLSKFKVLEDPDNQAALVGIPEHMRHHMDGTTAEPSISVDTADVEEDKPVEPKAEAKPKFDPYVKGVLARITACLCGHHFPIGTIVRFTGISNYAEAADGMEYGGHPRWALGSDEFEVLRAGDCVVVDKRDDDELDASLPEETVAPAASDFSKIAEASKVFAERERLAETLGVDMEGLVGAATSASFRGAKEPPKVEYFPKDTVLRIMAERHGHHFPIGTLVKTMRDDGMAVAVDGTIYGGREYWYVDTTEAVAMTVSASEYPGPRGSETITPVEEAPKAMTKKVEEKKVKKTRTLRDILVGQGVPEYLVDQLNEYRMLHKNDEMPESIKARIPKPTELYEGAALWIDCITAILAGRHILLSGGKATGKNTLAQSLAFAFQRPLWDMSFHSNIGKDEIIGSETFRGGEVVFNPGIAYTCAIHGGIGVLDEINMAKDNAIAVLNSLLDDRRVIDVPGYDRIHLHPATTFIGTMNYGYAGTRPLNEALASRFVIPEVKDLDSAGLVRLLSKKFPKANTDALKMFAGVFTDLQVKAKNAEISTASVDLRGIISALAMIEFGIKPSTAMRSNVVNKAFEEFERKIVNDVVGSRIPNGWESGVVFGSVKTVVVDMSGVK